MTMGRAGRIVVGVGAVSLVAMAVVELAFPGLDSSSPSEVAREAAKPARKQRASRGRKALHGPSMFDQRAAYRAGLSQEPERGSSSDPDIRPVTKVEAIADFEAYMGELESLADDGQVTDDAKIYRQANDAYTALSMMLDARDSSEAQLLENAHLQMRETLARLDIQPTSLRDAQRSTYKDRRHQRPGHWVPH